VTAHWSVRLGVLAAVVVALHVLLTIFDYDPHPVRLALLTTVAMGATWLVSDVLVDAGAAWNVYSEQPVSEGQLDPRLAAYLRTLEGHLTSSTADAGLRDRLAALADRRLAKRGLSRGGPSGAEARDLLGPDLAATLDGPPRRMTVAEITRHVTRIEEL
jgi:hypothetical protein